MTTTTALQGQVVAAASYLAGFDQDVALTSSTAKARFDAGYRFCLRYVAVGTSEAGNLDTAEANLILAAGLALMPVQHVNHYGWVPTQTLGQTHGQNAVANARVVGFPAGVCVWLDLEGVASGTAGGDVVAYCQAWYAEVNAAGYVPGLYVGPASGLTSEQLSELSFAHYWSSASKHLPVPARGFQMFQGLVEGGLDPDYVLVDGRGGAAMWLATVPAAYPTLRAGNTTASEAVRCLQRALVAAKAGALAIDGLFGSATTSAVEAFQRGAGLAVTGVADDPTWAALVPAATASAAGA